MTTGSTTPKLYGSREDGIPEKVNDKRDGTLDMG